MSEIKDTYNTISRISEGFYKEKGSKFIAFAYPVNNEEEIKAHIEQLKKEYYDARHHVYAWRLGYDDKCFRANDDGEPANSSGMPVLGQIRSFELTNILIVVVRYFGGTKLGVPGLINAYKTSAKEAIENNTIVEKQITETFRILFTYEDMNNVMRKLKELNLSPTSTQFEIDCQLQLDIRLGAIETFKQQFESLHRVKIEQI